MLVAARKCRAWWSRREGGGGQGRGRIHVMWRQAGGAPPMQTTCEGDLHTALRTPAAASSTKTTAQMCNSPGSCLCVVWLFATSWGPVRPFPSSCQTCCVLGVPSWLCVQLPEMHSCGSPGTLLPERTARLEKQPVPKFATTASLKSEFYIKSSNIYTIFILAN
jgi:hypothetical protein